MKSVSLFYFRKSAKHKINQNEDRVQSFVYRDVKLNVQTPFLIAKGTP